MELKSLFNRKSVLKQTASLLLVGAAAVVSQGVDYAHGVGITANRKLQRHGRPHDLLQCHLVDHW